MKDRRMFPIPRMLRWACLLGLLHGCYSLVQQGPGLYAATTSTTHTTTNPNQNLVGYATYWEKLLLVEHKETVEELRERRKTWSRQRLEASGLSIFGAFAEPDSEVFGDKIVRIYYPPKQQTKETTTHRDFRERFNRGDVLMLTPLTPRGNFGGGSTTTTALPRECLVVDVGTDWLTAGVGPSWPEGLWDARKVPGAFRVRLDRTAPQAPLKAQRAALNMLRKGKAGEAATIMANLFSLLDDKDKNSSRKRKDSSIPIGEVAVWTSGVPSCFVASTQSDENIWNALDQVNQLTSFEPNQSQKEAIVWALQRKISLIRGPPGTGKTRVAALLIATALRLRMSSPNNDETNVDNKDELLARITTGLPPRVLAVAHSNGAADVLLEALLQMGVPAVRMGRPTSVSANVQHRTVVAMAERMPEVMELRQKMASDNALDKRSRAAAAFELKQCLKDMRNTIVKAAPVVVTSCIGAHQLLSDEQDDGDDTDMALFPIVVLDEAAQTTEPALVCALASARANQVILVGDTRQLPPTVTCVSLRNSLGVSPMARLEQMGVGQLTLRVQYRMPPTLLEHPSRYFYNDLVSCANQDNNSSTGGNRGGVSSSLPPEGFPWPASQPLAFVSVGGGDSEVTHAFGGKSNPTEAKWVARFVSDLLAAGDVDASHMAVISPYSKQVQCIRTELSNRRYYDVNAQNVQVGTVDSFQGQETDIVIFSAVRSNPTMELGFLRDPRRLCVAITRAKRGLILVGDPTVLRTCRHWSALLDSCEQRGLSLNSKDFADRDELALSNIKKDNTNILGKDEVQDLRQTSSNELYGLFPPIAED